MTGLNENEHKLFTNEYAVSDLTDDTSVTFTDQAADGSGCLTLHVLAEKHTFRTVDICGGIGTTVIIRRTSRYHVLSTYTQVIDIIVFDVFLSIKFTVTLQRLLSFLRIQFYCFFSDIEFEACYRLTLENDLMSGSLSMQHCQSTCMEYTLYVRKHGHCNRVTYNILKHLRSVFKVAC